MPTEPEHYDTFVPPVHLSVVKTLYIIDLSVVISKSTVGEICYRCTPVSLSDFIYASVLYIYS